MSLRLSLGTIALLVVINCGKGAEEQAADVGQNGSAPGRDASFGEKVVECAEGMVDALGVLEFGRLPSKRFAEINGAR